MMTMTPCALHDPQTIMRKLGLSRQKLRYITESRNIRPVTRYGASGVFDDAGVAEIEQALASMRARRANHP
jgi:hypothetical protein